MKLKLLLIALPLLAACTATQQDVTTYPANGSKGINPDTHIVLNFTEEPTLNQEGVIRIWDTKTGKIVDSLDLSIPAGLTRGRTYGPECDYMKVPYDYQRDFVATNRNTVPGTPSCGAEPTPQDMQLTIIGGFTDGFRFYPVIVHGNTATIYPHNNMLEYGHSYKVTIDEAVFGKEIKPIKFKTKANGPADIHNLTVDCNGNADFNTVQGALDAVADFDSEPTTISIAPGDYEEIVYFRNKSNVTIKGAGMDQVNVHYANCEVFNPHPLIYKTNERKGSFPSRRAAFAIDNCTDITMQDMAVATDCYGQAEGLLINGERIKLQRVHITGSGDALQANGTIYAEECVLDGDGDTILGRGALFFYRSTLRNNGGPFSWCRNFKPAHGDIFVECDFEGKNERYPADFGRSSTNHGQIYPDAEVVVINCTTKNFNPLGFSAVGIQSQQMLEFQTKDKDSGELIDVTKRHPWSRQLDAVRDADLIASYQDPAFVLDGWNPRAE